ncbi:MAG: hypothetical protein EA381_11155 [Planctomycetaceae bacterium]|nr:MAG: hypothetical protein EA381_11155 [Planctomycetaceae bacterium]
MGTSFAKRGIRLPIRKIHSLCPVGGVMFKQLSLFDSVLAAELPHRGKRSVTLPEREQKRAGTRDPGHSVGGPNQACGELGRADAPRPAGSGGATSGELARQIERLEMRRSDEPRPLGDLARLVLARYDLVVRRRQASERLRRERPRKSIRVLSPVAG